MMSGKKILLLGEILKNSKDRKPTFKLLKDLLMWTLTNKGGVFYFYIYKLHLKGNNVKDFITMKEYNEVHDKLDPVYYRPLLEDKIIFDRYIKSFGVPSPEMLGIIERGRVFWLDNTAYMELDSLLDRDMNAYCKMVTAFGGKGVFRIDVDRGSLLLNKKPASIHDLKMALGNGKFILQQTLNQHEKLNRINPSCINTLRVYTISNGKEPELFGKAFRMGVNNSIVDNVSSNNLATGINEDHSLQEEAHTGTYPPQWLTHHPDSGIRFGDQSLPFLEEACKLCEDTHKYFGDFFFIAWDVAITPTGPVILEGNPAADLLGLQVLYGGQKNRFLAYAEEYSRSMVIP